MGGSTPQRPRRARVLVVGSANLDIVVPVPHLPRRGETVLGGPRGDSFGGKGANQAVAAARAGGGVRLVCMMGKDAAGTRYRRHLRAEGIDGQGLLEGAAHTGTALIAVDGAGDNQIVVSPGANALLTPRRLGERKALLNYGEVTLAQMEIPLGTVRLAFRAARRRCALTVLNPAPVSGPLPGLFLKLVDVLVPNLTEAAALLGRRSAPRGEPALLRSCRELLRLGPRAVVLTAGEMGAYYLEGRIGGRVRPPAGIIPVDTTGAGDALCGALAVRLAEGAPLGEALRFAVSAASLSVRKWGAQEGLPGRRAILRAMSGVVLERFTAG